jgi:hypothetical protein
MMKKMRGEKKVTKRSVLARKPYPAFDYLDLLARSYQIMAVFGLLGEHCGEDLDFRLHHRLVLTYPDSTSINFCNTLTNPLGHLSPNGPLANLTALYPFNGLPDLHRLSLPKTASTGVEKAMQTGLIASIALHTMTVRPRCTDLCIRFYRGRQLEAVSTHAEWASGFYNRVRRYTELPFWRARSRVPEDHELEQNGHRAPLRQGAFNLTTQVRISDKARFIEEPCIVGRNSGASGIITSKPRPCGSLRGRRRS